MHRFMPAVFAVAALVSATPSSVPATTAAPPPAQLMVIEYQVRAGSVEGPLLAGEVAVEPYRSTSFERRDKGSLNFSFEAQPQSDAVLIKLHWEERTEREQVLWSPAVLARPGRPVTSTVNWTGGSRTVTLTIR